jgi:alpha-N-arabinofuranosidase
LVNVIAPIMTEPGGAAWKQTIYFPYYFASVFGRGTALKLGVDSPGYDADIADNVPYLDISGVHDKQANTLAFFAVNRHATESLEMSVDLLGFSGTAHVIDHQVITHVNLKIANTLGDQNAVTPRAGSGIAVDGGRLTGKLPPYSYQMIRVQLG